MFFHKPPQTNGLNNQAVKSLPRKIKLLLPGTRPGGQYDKSHYSSINAEDYKPVKFKAVIHLIEQQVIYQGNKTCLVFGNQHISFFWLNSRANQVANYLIQLGICKNDVVPVCLNPGIEIMIAILAVLKTGAVYVPVDPAYPAARINFILSDLKATYIISTSGNQQLNNLQQLHVIDIFKKDAAIIQHQPVNNPEISIQPSDTAYIIYTSGSTGTPKGVVIQQSAFHHYLLNPSTRYINNDDNSSGSFIYLSNSFDASLTAMFMPMLYGKMAVISARDSYEIFEDENFWKYAPYDFLKITPAHLNFLAATVKDEKTWVTKKLVIGGEALYAGLFNFFAKKNFPLTIINEYGPTEATVGCTTFCFNLNQLNNYKSELPIGKPIQHSAIYLFEDIKGELKPSKKGEIYIGGPGIAQGYWNRPDLTAKKFIQNPEQHPAFPRLYKTGDLGRWLPDGNLCYMGRTDDQVKIAGYRVELGEIENAINGLGYISNCCVLAISQADVKKLACFYVLKYDALNTVNTTKRSVNEVELSVKKIIDGYLRQCLPLYMVPSSYTLLNTMPLTAHGKIDRHKLAEMPQHLSKKTLAGNAKNKTQRTLLAIWKQVLGTRNISVDDNFFELGGNSIQAAKMFTKLQSRFHQQLAVSALLHAPTIEKLSTLLQQPNESLETSVIVPFRVEGAKTPLFLIHGGAGNVLFYKELADKLGYDQPVYGIQAHGLDGKAFPHTTVEEMASFYVEKIMELQPKGPYKIAGYCFGAIVSSEMAYQFNKKGKQVSFFASINGVSPTYTHKPATEPPVTTINYGNTPGSKIKYHLQVMSTLSFAQKCNYPFKRLSFVIRYKLLYKLRLKVQMHLYKFRKTMYRYFLSRNKKLPRKLAAQFYYDNNWEMANHYKPKMFPGTMTVFRTPMLFPDPSLGWKKHSTNIETFDIDGHQNNRRMILHEPCVSVLAEKLKKCLNTSI